MKLQTLAGTPVPRVGLGCMGMSEFYGPSSDSESLAALHLGFELGYRHLDTADFYGAGHNEELLSKFLRELGARRDELLVATKCGLRRKPGPTPAVEIDTSPEYIVAACEESLRRLGLETIDLYYLHRRSPEVSIERSVEAMAGLQAAGKVRGLGLSEVSSETLRAACRVATIDAVQSELSLWTRDPEASVLPACRQLQVDFVAYSPLGRGFLAGKVDPSTMAANNDLRQHLPRFAPGNFEVNSRLLATLEEVGTELGVPASAVALSWVLAQAPFVSVIPGARKPEHLRANMAALRVELDSARLARLSQAFDPAKIAGARYPEALLSTVNV